MKDDLIERLNAYSAVNENHGGIAEEAAKAIIEYQKELRLCRNELCLKCGLYKMRHNGACNGCRWKEM